MKNKLSIIIPCYKESDNKLLFTISDLLNKFHSIEIIISDGIYNINTKKILDKYNNIVYLNNSNRTRSSGMNLGAKNASGDIFLFLHCDTILPKKTTKILENLNLEKYSYGGFYKKFDKNTFGLTLNSFFTNLKLKYFGTLLGDNSIFISKELFKKIGGFPDISLMEDVEISKKLKKYGKIKLIKAHNITSSRKFTKKGFFKTIMFMQYMRLLYFFGVKTDILNEKYKKFGKK